MTYRGSAIWSYSRFTRTAIFALTVPGTMMFPTVLVAGAFGGLVSVLTRITRGAIRVPDGGRDAEIRFLGMLRPFVGVVFGTTSGEVWASADEGETWSCLASHLPEIYSVEVSTTR